MDIELGDFSIRSYRKGDADSLVQHGDNRRIWIQLRDGFPHPYTRKHAAAWIRTAIEQEPETHFAIAVRDQAIGGIGFRLGGDVYRRSAELGFWLGEEFWGRGIATRAVQAMAEHAFARFDLARIYALVFETNPASARVLEKAGFTLEGRLRKSVTKDGKTIDEFLYARVRE